MHTRSRPGGRRSQSERRDTARTAILEAAIALLAEGGYESMTLADIGERAGCSRSLATHYFGSKPRLIAAVIAYIVDRDPGRIPDQALRGVDRLRAEVALVFRGLRSRPLPIRAYHVIAHQAATTVPEILPAIHRQNRAYRDLVRQALREGVAGGDLSPELDVDAVAIALTAMLRGVVWEWFSDGHLDLAASERALEHQIAALQVRRGE